MRFHRRPDGSMPDEDDGDAWLWLVRGTGPGDYLARLRKLEQTWSVALGVRMLGYAICAALMEKEAPMLVMDELSLRAAKGVREIKDVIVKPPRPDPSNKRKRTPLAVLQNTLEHGAGTLNDPIMLD